MAPSTPPRTSSLLAISFDLYGTLLRYDDLDRSWRDWNTTLHEQLTQQGTAISAEELPKVCRGFFDGNHSPVGAFSVLESRIAQLAERLGATLSAPAVAHIADECCHAWQRSISLDPECHETLEALAGRYRLFLVSNFDHPRHARQVLDTHGLAGFFEDILISGEQGLKKPDEALFGKLRDKHGVESSQCAHVGDSIDDYQFALNSGIVPVMLGEQQRINGKIDFMENESRTVSGAYHAARLRHVVEVISSLG